MNRSEVPSLKAAITRTVLWIVATVVISAGAVREVWRTRDLEQSEAATAITITRVLGAQCLIDAADDRAKMQEACRRMCRQSLVLGAWIVEGDHILASACRDDTLDHAVRELPIQPGNTVRFTLPVGGQGGSAPLRLADADLRALGVDAGDDADVPRPGSRNLRLLMLPPPVSKRWYHDLWVYCAPILAVGAIGSVVGLRRLDREVISPISRLEALARGEAVHVSGSSSGDHPDELSELITAMSTMRDDLNTWRARAQQTARSVDEQVAERTQEVYRELKRAQREVWTDPLTGLNNRRAMNERFPAIFDAQCEARQDLSVVMIDVDHFKMLNDTLGHQAGDELIRFTAELLRGSLRENDLAIRYGGDEFLLVLPSVSVETAEKIAQRISALFSQRVRLLSRLPKRPSLSAGVASLISHTPRSATELLAYADKALYDAKDAGRATVRVYAGSDSAACGGTSASALTSMAAANVARSGDPAVPDAAMTRA